MGSPVDFQGANLVLTAPDGVENVSPLPCFENGKQVVSCWLLDAAERAEIARTGRVFLVVVGRSQPPVFVGSAMRAREMTADHGVFPKYATDSKACGSVAFENRTPQRDGEEVMEERDRKSVV